MEEKIKYLLEILCKGYNGSFGKKVTQKLFYFLEREGIDLGLRYGIHFYGPYSARLNDTIYSLEDEGCISIDDGGHTHIIHWVGDGSRKSEVLSSEEVNIANKVVNEFGSKSALDLEGLATIDYLVSKEADCSKGHIIQEFLKIKGGKFSEIDAREYYEELKELQLI